MCRTGKKKTIKRFIRLSSGQTLIETIVAVALLATGIIGSMSLAIFAVGSSETTLNQIIATNLAREGTEVVRNMRDTNWMNDTLANCPSIGSGQQCYSNWLSQSYDIRGTVGGGQDKTVRFNPATNNWSISNGGGPAFRLYTGANATYVHGGAGSYRFFRRITIIQDQNPPFNDAVNPRLRVISVAWWTGKRCPDVNDPASTTCKVSVEQYLTNWRNY